MPSPIASVSLVVRTHNEGRYLDRVLAAAKGCGPVLTEIVVVDSGSDDATLDIAKAHGAKIVCIEKAEFSFGRSLNLGCAASRGEVVVFLSGSKKNGLTCHALKKKVGTSLVAEKMPNEVTTRSVFLLLKHHCIHPHQNLNLND